MFSDLNEVMAATPALVAGVVFVLSLLVGSFLNVVIHRLPIMLHREWKAQAHEVLAEHESKPEPSPVENGSSEEQGLSTQPCLDVEHVSTEPSRQFSPADDEKERIEPSHEPSSPDVRQGSEEPASARVSHRAPIDSATADQRERYNLLVPRSRCPHCNAEIQAHQNIPVLSYLLLGGKCANCRARISPRYPIVEFVTALLSTAVA